MDALCFLVFNSRRIDVLHLEHLQKNLNLIAGWLYKFLNPRGFLYIKLDASPHIMDNIIGSRPALKSRIKRWLLNYLMQHTINAISVESIQNFRLLKKRLENVAFKILHIPNGIDLHPEVALSKSQKWILTAGRLGPEQKATDVLLEAFRLMPANDWYLILAGPVEEAFQSHIDRYFEQNPHLKTRVKFLGNITSRSQLFEIYAQASIFCFPSRWEGFSHALMEAAYFANYIISTDIGGAEDILSATSYGKIAPKDDPRALSAILEQTIANWGNIHRDPLEIQKIVANHFSWEKVCRPLYETISTH
ncbi:MAG: glycosyltransferase family 4 protein [Methylacidiphilales bacterium]|nr:glycosyltransferase family 4 protein [Candidatus Methylacidiphilales bacterium]